jgi:hypothetical protein
MTKPPTASGQPAAIDGWAVIGRAVATGAGAGAAVGGIVGTFLFPIVMTFGGAVVGAPIGSLIGLLNGLALARIVRRTNSSLAYRVSGAAVSAGAAIVAVTLASSLTALRTLPIAGAAAFSAGCGLLGFILGPFAVHGPGSLERAIQRSLVLSLIAGAAIGAVVGLVLGLVNYAPTAIFAVFEGAVLGGGVGAVLGLIITFALIGRRQFSERRSGSAHRSPGGAAHLPPS